MDNIKTVNTFQGDEQVAQVILYFERIEFVEIVLEAFVWQVRHNKCNRLLSAQAEINSGDVVFAAVMKIEVKIVMGDPRGM